MGLGQIAVSAFNKGVDGFNWAQGNAASLGRLCSKVPGGAFVADFCNTWYQKIPDDIKTYFLKPVGLIHTSVKYFEWKWAANWLVEYSKQAAMAKAMIQSTDIFKAMRDMRKAFSSTIDKHGSDSKPRDVLVGGVEVAQKIEVKNDMSAERTLAARGNVLATLMMATGYSAHELSVCMDGKFPVLLDRSISWLQMGAGVYMGLYGAYEEREFAYAAKARQALVASDSSVCKEEKHLRYAKYALNITYLAYSILGMAGLYYGKASGTMLKRLQFVASVGTTVVPIVQGYLQEQVNKKGEGIGKVGE